MKLILINGAPATGKTTLAAAIQKETGIVLIAKDTIKEFLFDTLGIGDREWSKILGRATNDFLYILADSIIASGRSVMMENAFEKMFAVEKIKQLTGKYGVECIEIYCTVDGSIRQQRFIDRNENGERHAGHVDVENYNIHEDEATILEKYAPLRIGTFVEVDTSNPSEIDIASLVQMVKTTPVTP